MSRPDDADALSRRAARSWLALAVEGGISTLASVASLFVMARLVGPAEVGLFALAIGLVMIANLLIEGFFQDALVQRTSLEPAHLETAAATAAGAALAAFGVLAGAATALEGLFEAPGFAPVLVASAASLLVGGVIAVPVARLRRGLRIGPLLVSGGAGRLAGAVLGPLLAWGGWGAWSFVAQHLCASAIAGAIVLNAERPVRPRFSGPHFRALAGFAVPGFVLALARGAQARLLLAAFGIGADLRAVGFLGMALRIVETLHEMMSERFYRVALPLLSRLQHERAAFAAAWDDSMRLYALLACPVLAGIFAVAPALVPVLLGPDWLPVVAPVRALAAIALVLLVIYQCDVVPIALGRIALPAACFALTLPAMVAAVVLAAPERPAVAALLWYAPLLALAPLWLVRVARTAGWSVVRAPAPTLRAAFVAVLMAGTVELAGMVLPAAPLPRLGAQVAVGLAAYGLFTLACNRASLRAMLTRLR